METHDMDDNKVDTIHHSAPTEATDLNGKKVDTAQLASLAFWEIPSGPRWA
jgi:hypothetical protein